MDGRAERQLLSKFGLAMIAVLWAYEGWQFVTYSAGEVIEPQRNFPRSLLWSVLFLIAVYCSPTWATWQRSARSSCRVGYDCHPPSAVLGPSAAKGYRTDILVSSSAQ